MQRISVYMLLIVLETVIEAGVITNGADPKLTLDMTEASRAEIVDQKHKSQFPKNYLKVDTTEPYVNVHTKQQSVSQKKFVPKNTPEIKNKLITRNLQQVKDDPTINGKNSNETHIPNVNAYTSGDKTIEDVAKNISIEEQTGLYVAKITINEDKVTDISGNCTCLSDQENREKKKDNEEKNEERPTLMNFLRMRYIKPANCDNHSDGMKERTDEKLDLDEFIFLEELDDNGEVQDYDMTTEFFVNESRFKRSINVIEEENVGTTVSAFKYTSPDARLSNDLFYKNINS